MVQPHIRLGDLLVEMELITEENLRYVLDEQRSSKRRLGQLLIDKGFLSEEELLPERTNTRLRHGAVPCKGLTR